MANTAIIKRKRGHLCVYLALTAVLGVTWKIWKVRTCWSHYWGAERSRQERISQARRPQSVGCSPAGSSTLQPHLQGRDQPGHGMEQMCPREWTQIHRQLCSGQYGAAVFRAWACFLFCLVFTCAGITQKQCFLWGAVAADGYSNTNLLMLLFRSSSSQ